MKTCIANTLARMVLLIVVSALCLPNLAQADTSPLTDTFSIKPVIPSNQKANITNYFSIYSEEDLTGEYEVQLRNDNSEPMKVEVTTLNAFTSSDGSIRYSEGDILDGSVMVDNSSYFKKFVDIEEEITLEPNSVTTYSFEVNIPKQEGSILGGLSFKTVGEGNASGNEEVTIQIKNEVNSIIAFEVDFGLPNTTKVEFGDVSLIYSEKDSFLYLPIKSNNNYFIENADMNYQVFNRQGELLFESPKDTKINLVRTVDFDYKIPWTHSTIDTKEEYLIKGNLKVESTGEAYVFEKIFKYEYVEEDNTLIPNTGGVTLMKNEFSAYQIGVIAFIIAVTIFALIKVISVIIMKKQRKDETNKYRETAEDVRGGVVALASSAQAEQEDNFDTMQQSNNLTQETSENNTSAGND